MSDTHNPVVATNRKPGRGMRCGLRVDYGRTLGHSANILRVMRQAIALVLLAGAACHSRKLPQRAATDSSARPAAPAFPLRRDSSDTSGDRPQVISDPSVVVFWLKGVDTLSSDDRASAFDDLRSYTAEVASVLADNDIQLLATRSDTLYISLPNKQRRAVLLSGLDYPYGYVLVDPGGPERILTGVYSGDDLLDELRAYFDLPDESDSGPPRSTT